MSGNGGHDRTFATAATLVQDIGLSPADAYDLLHEWNLRCTPPWTEAELRHKLADAETKASPRGGKPRGWMAADRDRGAGSDDNAGGDAGERLSAADLMVSMYPPEALFHSHDDKPYLDGGRACVEISSPAFGSRLRQDYYRATGKAANADQIMAAVNMLAARAIFDGPERDVFLRFAAHDGKVYVALYDDDDTVVEIDESGWRLAVAPPVRFRKSPICRSLPVPVPGGTLESLWPFLNVPDADGKALLLAFLTAALMNTGPAAHLVLTGEQGSAKTTTANLVQRLLDPTDTESGMPPVVVDDLGVMAQHTAVLSFDNLSYLSPDMSDALCRLSTGGAMVKRRLHTNDELRVLKAKRPVILNGISVFAKRPDFLDRAIILRHPPLPPGRRRSAADLEADFAAALPALLGALFSRVACGLRELPKVRAHTDIRMFDFARAAVACEIGAGEPPVFLDAYVRNRQGGQVDALDDTPVAAAVVEYLGRHLRIRAKITCRRVYLQILALATACDFGSYADRPRKLLGSLGDSRPTT